MRAIVQIEVEPLPPSRLLAFHSEIGTATLDDRTFQITRSMSGLHFAIHEQVDGITVTHTVDLNSVLQVALEAIVKEHV